MRRDRVRFQGILSDLHLAAGGQHEPFKLDNAFVQLLAYLDSQAKSLGGNAELIINGDFLELLWVPPLGPDSWRDCEKKLSLIRNAHPDIFEGLARFTQDQGNYLTVLAGNHDLELALTTMQVAMADAVHPNLDPKQVFPNEENGPHFKDMARGAFTYRSGDLYIEHGNQFDPANSVNMGSVQSGHASDGFRLPWGSHLVYDVVMPLAKEHGFISRLEPHWLAIPLLFLIDPSRAMREVPSLARLGRAKAFEWIAQCAQSWAQKAYEGSRSSLSETDDIELGCLAEIAGDLEQLIELGDHGMAPEGAMARSSFLSARANVARFILRNASTTTGKTRSPDGICKEAIRRARSLGAKTVICGHTHGARDFRENDVRYVNSGTWTSLYEPVPEAQDILCSDGRLMDDAFKPMILPTFIQVEVDAGDEGLTLMQWRRDRPAELQLR